MCGSPLGYGQHLEHVGVRRLRAPVARPERGRPAARLRRRPRWRPPRCARRAHTRLPAGLDLVRVVAVLCHRRSQVSGRPACRARRPPAASFTAARRASAAAALRSGCGRAAARRPPPAPCAASRRRTAAAGRTRCRAGSPARPCRRRSRAASASAMSMPAETPAAVTILPSNTTRSATGSAPSRAQLLERQPVARGALARRAARRRRGSASRCTRTSSTCSCGRPRCSHSSTGPPARAATSPGPPGTSTMSGCARVLRASARRASVSMPLSVRTGPGSAATNVTLAPGRRLSTS